MKKGMLIPIHCVLHLRTDRHENSFYERFWIPYTSVDDTKLDDMQWNSSGIIIIIIS